jgi:3-oxoacyl-[acyl-carrier protein] reductase
MTDGVKRVALVTGGSRGIGRAIAERLAADGMPVAINYLANEEAAQEVVDGINAAGGEAIAVAADVGIEADVAAMFATVGETFESPSVLVNNAGITRDNLLLRMSAAEWDDVMATNLRSVFLCTKTALRGMLKARWGRIVNVSSVSGLAGNPGQSNYAAAKSGIIGFTKSVAKEVGSRGITVNAVAPGFIATDMTAGLSDDLAADVARQTSVGRLGTADEVASAVAYLVSGGAAYVTGQTIVVDGGLAI